MMQISIANSLWLFLPLLSLALGLVALAFLAKSILRYVIRQIAVDATTKLLSDKYTQNLMELLPSLKRFSVLNVVELSLRAEEGRS